MYSPTRFKMQSLHRGSNPGSAGRWSLEGPRVGTNRQHLSGCRGWSDILKVGVLSAFLSSALRFCGCHRSSFHRTVPGTLPIWRAGLRCHDGLTKGRKHCILGDHVWEAICAVCRSFHLLMLKGWCGLLFWLHVRYSWGTPLRVRPPLHAACGWQGPLQEQHPAGCALGGRWIRAAAAHPRRMAAERRRPGLRDCLMMFFAIFQRLRRMIVIFRSIYHRISVGRALLRLMVKVSFFGFAFPKRFLPTSLGGNFTDWRVAQDL